MDRDSLSLPSDFPISSKMPLSSGLGLQRRSVGRLARSAIESTNAVFALYRAFRDGLTAPEQVRDSLDGAIHAVDDLARSLRAMRDGIDEVSL
jgi:hypothetical protein